MTSVAARETRSPFAGNYEACQAITTINISAVADSRQPDKKGPGQGPKEKAIAATLTAAAVALAGASPAYSNLAAAGDAIADDYAKMFDLIARPPRA